MSGIGGVSMADTSPTHINQLNSTAHHQTANQHVDTTGSVGMFKISILTKALYILTSGLLKILFNSYIQAFPCENFQL